MSLYTDSDRAYSIHSESDVNNSFYDIVATQYMYRYLSTGEDLPNMSAFIHPFCYGCGIFPSLRLASMDLKTDIGEAFSSKLFPIV